MLTVSNLASERNEQVLFQNLSFVLRPGEIIQIIGANGSGKTTLLRMLCGLTNPGNGNISWEGASVDQIRERYLSELIYIGHRPGVKGVLTPIENLKLALAKRGVHARHNILHILEQIGLHRVSHKPAEYLSEGQQRRLALAKLLIFPATLWILDEPFTALDKEGIELMESMFARHGANGGMAVLTSHQKFNGEKMSTYQLVLSDYA